MSLRDLNDGQLLARFASAEDTLAFDELYRRHSQAVLRICQRAAGRSVDAEDILQTVFLLLADKAAELTKRPCIVGWLYRAAWNTGSRHRRAAWTRQRHERRAAAEAGAAVTDDRSLLLASEMQYEMEDAVAKLPDDYSDAIVLHHFHGLTVQETARLLGENPGTVASKLSRGRNLLRVRLAKRGLVLTSAAVGVVLAQSTMQISAISLIVPGASTLKNAFMSAGASAVQGAAVSAGITATTMTMGSSAGSIAWKSAVGSLGKVALGSASVGASSFGWVSAGWATCKAVVACTVATMASCAISFGIADAVCSPGHSSNQSTFSISSSSSSSDSSSSSSSSSSGGGYSSSSAAIPEPGSMLLLAGGSLLLALRRRAPLTGNKVESGIETTGT